MRWHALERNWDGVGATSEQRWNSVGRRRCGVGQKSSRERTLAPCGPRGLVLEFVNGRFGCTSQRVSSFFGCGLSSGKILIELL